MKHLSMWLEVLLLGAMPLVAAALDYGPNRSLLAAESGAPQLPGAQTRSASMGAMSKPVADDDVLAPAAAPRVSPSTSSPPSIAAPRSHGPSANNKPHNTTPPQPAVESGPASWRSLLPGSIQ